MSVEQWARRFIADAEERDGCPPLYVSGDACLDLARAYLSSQERVKKMQAALKPFADIADHYHDSEDDTHEIWVDSHERGTRVTLGMCKMARVFHEE